MQSVSPRLKIRPCDLDLWPWKSIQFQIRLRSKYVPSQNPLKDVDSRVFTRMLCSKHLTWWPDLWPWKSIGFQILFRTKYVPCLVKIHWRMLILECSQGCYGRTEGRTDDSITISLRNFVGEGIITVVVITRC